MVTGGTHRPDYPTRVYAHPADYFMGDTESKNSNGTRLIMCGMSVFCALTGSIMFNVYSRRPLKSGMQRHIGIAAFAFIVSNYYHFFRLDKLAERDAAIRHYIELHPDDFPPFDRKKFKDVLHPWIPRR